jgi:hypothetical protein
MSKIIQLTENSWLVKANINDSGLLFQKPEGFIFLKTNSRTVLADEKTVKREIGKLPRDVTKQENEISHIGGYPVKHENVTPVENDKLIPLYNRGTKIIFAAGYWCVRFNQNWSLMFCPKQKTLEEYENVGPFKNKLEASAQINKLKIIEQQK